MNEHKGNKIEWVASNRVPSYTRSGVPCADETKLQRIPAGKSKRRTRCSFNPTPKKKALRRRITESGPLEKVILVTTPADLRCFTAFSLWNCSCVKFCMKMSTVRTYQPSRRQFCVVLLFTLHVKTCRGPAKGATENKRVAIDGDKKKERGDLCFCGPFIPRFKFRK